MTATQEVIVNTLFLRLGVSEASEIHLERGPNIVALMYIAKSGARRTYVDRALAVVLRRMGASWAGDIRNDPYASA